MIPELGVLALVLALGVAIVQACLPLAGAWRGIEGWMAVARPAALAQCLFVGLAFACLAWSFLDHDYSVLYVASNSHDELPAPYRFAAIWGGHEGSMLLWLQILALWSLAVARCSRGLPEAQVARVLAVMAWLSEKVQIASSTVQPRKAPRLSVTASEWIRAVPTSPGM